MLFYQKQASVELPYSYRCPYCGTQIQDTERINALGYEFKGGYANQASEQILKASAGLRARTNMAYELEYAEKRLDHYRSIVADGRLKAYLETAKAQKADWFRVEPGSPLETYLKETKHKTDVQAKADRAKLRAFPYNWKDTTVRIKCSQCGQVLPWSIDLSCFWQQGLAGIIGAAVFFLLLAVQGSAKVTWLGIVLPCAAGLVAGFVSYPFLCRRKLRKYAALPWNAEDLPCFDPVVLAAKKAEYSQGE